MSLSVEVAVYTFFLLASFLVPASHATISSDEAVLRATLTAPETFEKAVVEMQIDGESYVFEGVEPEGIRRNALPDGSVLYTVDLETLSVEHDGETFDIDLTVSARLDDRGITYSLSHDHSRSTSLPPMDATPHELGYSLSLPDLGVQLDYVTYGTQGCFLGETPITLWDGGQLPAEDVRVGMYLADPVTGEPHEVLEVIRGPERLPLIGLSVDGEHWSWVTQEHPIWTPRGLLPAQELGAGDELLGADGEWHPVHLRRRSFLHPPLVYNFVLDAGPAPEDHLLLAGGLVMGDDVLQARVASH